MSQCQNPILVKSPENRWLRKCRKENRSFEYYVYQANQRRNIIYDPVLLIDNPRDYYDYHFKFEDRKMYVPCGRCDACLKSKVDDYFIRSYFEYMRCLDAKNGSVWFGTLTYADSQLPRLSDGTPCFNKEHLQNFVKRLRRRSNWKFKIFYVSEFGGEFGRPHYHFLLFIDDLPPSDDMQFRVLSFVANSWTKIEDRSSDEMTSMRYLGFDDLQRVDVCLVDSPKLLRYTSKYVGKQIGSDDFDKLDIDSRYKRFHHASLGFGDCLLDYANNDVWEKGYVSVDGFHYSIPQYYKTKMSRDYMCTMENGSIVYKPSSEGLFYQWNVSLHQISDCKNLSRLNKDFPKPPQWVYDPSALERLEQLFQNRYLDSDFTDPLFNDFLHEWNCYLDLVRTYNKNKIDAKILHWKQQQTDHYLKKTGRK